MPKKHLKEIVKEDVKKVSKEVKKNWKKIIIISGIIFFIVSTILLITGIRVSFSIYDRLVINLNPSDSSFTVTNDQNQNITFLTSIKDSIFCSVECKYEFYDRSNNTMVDHGSYLLKDKGSFNKTYELIPYQKGSGQKIYNFDVECKDIDTFLCATHSLSRKKSSFIILNYELTDYEQKLKDDLKIKFTKGFSNINNASKNLQYLNYTLSLGTLISGITLKEDYDLNSKHIKDILIDVNNIYKLWSDEEYNNLNLLYGSSFLNKSEDIYSKSVKSSENINKLISQQNVLTIQYNEIKDYFFELDSSYDRYYEGDKLIDIHDYLDYIKDGFEKKDYNSINGFEKDILNVSYDIYDLNKTLINNYNDYLNESKTVYLDEYSKKCDLGYCDNVTDYSCETLSSLFEEYKNKTYNLPENFTNSSFYLVVNGSVSILISNDSKKVYEKYCTPRKELNLIENLSLIVLESNLSFKDIIENELTENLPTCCVYGKCSACCINEECKDDPNLYPVLLVHGHSLIRRDDPEPLLDMFSKIQYQMQEDGYINAGTVLFESNIYDYKYGDWGLSGYPVSAKASYYYEYFYSLGKYVYITRNIENVDTYAIRLNDIIKLLKYRTGKSKVNIIAHSMGGLVTRRYMQIFGEDSLNNVILIATPNHGISGDVKKVCRAT